MYFCYIPSPDIETAKMIARHAVEANLAACGNILPEMKSIFPWEGKVEESNESLLILKTLEEHQEPLKSLVEELHPYDTPCIAFFPAQNVNTSYSQWISMQLRQN